MHTVVPMTQLHHQLFGLVLLSHTTPWCPVLLCCSNTLVCDTKEEAQQLAFEGSERHKVVSLDGTLFRTSGVFTGGVAQNESARARRFDEAEYDKLKVKRDELRQELEVTVPSSGNHVCWGYSGCGIGVLA